MKKTLLIYIFISIFVSNFSFADQPILRLKHTSLNRGEVTYFIIDLPDDESIKGLKVETFKHNLQLIKINEKQALGFIAANYDTIPGEYFLDVSWHRAHRSFSKQYPIAIMDKAYQNSYVTVPPDKVDLNKSDQKRAKREKLMLKRDVFTKPINSRQWKGEFILPIDSKVTSEFGVQRILNGKKSSYHSGTDFRAAVGSPIKSANNGIVRFAQDLLYGGNVVIVDHGNDIFSSYSHLSEFKVKKGDVIKKGQVIGLAGTTGRVNGPHLHFGMRVNNTKVNPIAFIRMFNRALEKYGHQVA